ncbi:MAG: dihydroorotase [Campylobacterota bacterium]|nr:dihydroorotase [Campylobacterota bacterium]
MVITNIVVCDAKGERRADVKVVSGKIVEVGDDLQDSEVIDGKGAYLLPGLIDANVRLKDSLLSIASMEKLANEALRGGVTTVVMAPDCKPAVIDEISLEFIQKNREHLQGATIETMIATNDEDEMLSNIAILLKRGAVAPYMTTSIRNNVACTIAQYVKMYDTTLFCKAQDTSLSSVGVMTEGAVATKLGLVGIPPLGETVHVARMIEIAREFDIRILFKSIASPRSIEMINRAKQEGVDVQCEVSIMHLMHCDEACDGFNTTAKITPPLATKENMLLLQEALKRGEVDLLSTLHRPNSPVNKEVAFADASYGSEAITEALPLYYSKLVKGGLIDLPTLMKLTAQRTAALIGKEGGMIEAGMDADLILFDPEGRTEIDNPQSLFDKEVLQGAITMRFKQGAYIGD